MASTKQRLEDLQRSLKQAETDQARIGGQLEQLETRYKDLIASLKAEGFKTPEEARLYVETELASLEKAEEELQQRLSPILKEIS